MRIAERFCLQLENSHDDFPGTNALELQRSPTIARRLPLLPTPRRRRVDALLGNYKRAPGHFAEGDGVYLIDSEGKRYLDFVSGIAVNALGYGDPGLRAAMHSAADGLIHVSNLYATEPGEQLAAALVNKSFASKVFLCNSGAEANEGAFKFARRWARGRGDAKHEIIALRGAFHGRSVRARLPPQTGRRIAFRSGRSRPELGSSSATSKISPSR